MKSQKNSIEVKKELFFYPKFKQKWTLDKENHLVGIRNGSRRVVAGVIDSNNNLHVGVAQCSLNDVFNKKAGKKIALQRATSSKVPHIVVKIENPNKITEQFVAIARKAQALPKSKL